MPKVSGLCIPEHSWLWTCTVSSASRSALCRANYRSPMLSIRITATPLSAPAKSVLGVSAAMEAIAAAA